MRKIALVLALTTSALLAASVSAEEGAPAKPAPAHPGAVAAAPGAPPGMHKLPETIKLTEKDVTGFIDASTKLRKVGIDEQTDASGKQPESMAEALAMNKDAMKIIDAHGFTPERFQSVAYNIGMALAADEMKKKPEELAAARANQEQALAQMKEKLTPEQYAQMKARLELASGMVDQLQKLPPENLELVRKYAPQIHGAVGE